MDNISTIQIRSLEQTVYNLDKSSLDLNYFEKFNSRVDQIKGIDNTVVLESTSSSVIERIISYLLHNSKNSGDYLTVWNREFIKKFTGDELTDMLWTADYLGIDQLVDLGKKRLLSLTDNKSVNLIRKILKINSNFSQEEEDFIHEDCRWEEL